MIKQCNEEVKTRREEELINYEKAGFLQYLVTFYRGFDSSLFEPILANHLSLKSTSIDGEVKVIESVISVADDNGNIQFQINYAGVKEPEYVSFKTIQVPKLVT